MGYVLLSYIRNGSADYGSGYLGNMMWVFIKGISKEVSVKQLHKLITRQLNPLWSIMPIRGVKVEESKILKIMHTKSRVWEYYGLVCFKPSRQVHAVIGRLNTIKINLITHKPQPFSRSDKALAEYVKQQRATVQS
ncbi:MAG: hypothetical protein AB2533_16010, partial [Candidatus Thiodiazotropha endolucinida]